MIDDLFNGASGKVVGIEFNSKGDIELIVVKFDDENCGQQLKDAYANVSKKYWEFNGTPIYRYEHEYSLKTKGGKFLGSKQK